MVYDAGKLTEETDKILTLSFTTCQCSKPVITVGINLENKPKSDNNGIIIAFSKGEFLLPINSTMMNLVGYVTANTLLCCSTFAPISHSLIFDCDQSKSEQIRPIAR